MKEFTITYRDEPAGIRADTIPSASSQASFADLTDILDADNSQPQAATFEDGYWILGKDFKLFPDDPSACRWGLFSLVMCDADGVFDPPLTLTLSTGSLYSSVGLSFVFDPYGPTWCKDLTIAWYRGDTLVHQQDYTPDGWQYSALAQVSNFNRVEVTFRRMSAGYRYLKIPSIIFGITRTFDSNECFGVDLHQDADLISDELSINTMDFTLRNTSGITYMFQRRQVLRAKYGSELMGLYYISSSEKLGGGKYQVHSVDLLGLLEMAGDHMGGMYDGVPADTLASDILGGIVPYEMDAALKNVLIYGYLPIASRRDNLRQLAFALSAMVSAAHSEWLVIKRTDTPHVVRSFGLSRDVYEDGSIGTGTLVTAVSVTAHSYLASTEQTTLYEGVLTATDGDVPIKFDSPAHSLTITGGTIVSSNCNHAVIRGTGGKVVLKGCGYTHVERVHTKSNPLRNANDESNEVMYKDMTLVTDHNVDDVLAACYDINLRIETIKGKVLTETERPGDHVSIVTEDDGVKTGHLLSLDYTVSTKLAADVEILADYEEDDT